MPTKVHLVKAMGFTLVMYGCESWTIKKAEHRRINVFELWYWRRLLRVFTHIYSKEMKPVHPKENQPWILLEGLMLKLKLQYFGHLMQRADSLEKTRMLGRLKAEGEGRRRRGLQRMRWLDGITDLMDMNLCKVWEMVRVREGWCSAVHGVVKSWTRLRDWTTTTIENLF